MHRMVWCFLSVLPLLPAQTFEGTYSGKLPQGEMKLILTQPAASQVRGQLQLPGASIPLSGTVENGVLRGVITTGAANGQFEARRVGDRLSMRVTSNGQVEQHEFQAVSAAAPSAAGRMEDRRAGFRFRPPDGWIVRQTEAGFVMGSNTEPGLIILKPHTFADMETLKREAAQGWVDPTDQVNMPVSGPMRQTGTNGVTVELAGTVQGEKARAHAAGLLSPFGGGVVIVATTSEEKYGPQYQKLTSQLAASMEFFKPDAPKEDGAWTQRLSGRCVAYLKSSYSTGPSFGGYSTGSGWSEKRYLFLFEDGRFQAMGSFSGAFDSGGGFGSVNSGPQKQSGTWKVVDQAPQPRLVLEHTAGGRESFALSRQGTQTYLDGRRWFVVSHDECK